MIAPPHIRSSQHKKATSGKKSIQGIGAAITDANVIIINKEGIIFKFLINLINLFLFYFWRLKFNFF